MKIAIPLLLSALAAPSCNRTGDSDPPPESAPTPVPVRVATVVRQTLRPSVDLTATLEILPEREAVATARVAGWIQSVEQVEGEHIEAGAALVQLDPRRLLAARTRARARVDELCATLDRLVRGARPQEIEAARQDHAEAQARVHARQAEVEAAKALLDRGEMSAPAFERLDQALAEARAAAAALAARQALVEAGSRAERIAEAEAQLRQAEAALDTAQLDLDLCTIAAPIRGTVHAVSARRGLYVDAGTTLARVIDTSALFAHLRIPRVYLASVRIGTKVDVQVPGLEAAARPGTIQRLNAKADPGTGDLDAYALLANPAGDLRPGLACRLRVHLPEVPDAVVIPSGALADRMGIPVVTAVRASRAHEVELEIGVRTPELVEVRSGLQPGDVVITAGGYSLPENCPVKISPPPAAVQGDHR